MKKFLEVFFASFWAHLAFSIDVKSPPNIVVILVDDVGWNDISYNTNNNSLISTPNLDQLSSRGIRLKNHYVQTTCTPTRASLLTGRYAANTGLIYAMVPGSPAGLPLDIPTMPQLLRNQGYKTNMVGKWHLGHSQWAQTPVGRGFDEHIGSYMWDLDSYTKQQFELPWEPLVVDWVHAHSNGSYHHYAEPRHSTEAITQNAINLIIRHSKLGDPMQPLFLYVAYTACHSPLQAMKQHEINCRHIPHLWRRQFCGMMKGLDEGIQNISNAIHTYLGENTILYLSSDNGGSTWFGGLNTPLRGGKSTPYEGGVRVPAFIVDYTHEQRYLGTKSTPEPREYSGLMHSADILPTLLGFAGVTESQLRSKVVGLDGYDFGPYFRSFTNNSPRSEVLLELYNKNECIFKNESMHSYLVGEMKLIEGIVRDPHHHYESSIDWMNSTDPTFVTTRAQLVIRFLEWIFGQGPFDNSRIVLSHSLYHTKILQPQMKGLETIVRLYNLTADPEERLNIADQHPEIVEQIRVKIKRIIDKRPYQQPYWMGYHLSKEWPKTFKSGDCSMNPKLNPSSCHFTHPWIPDDVNPWKDLESLTDSLIYAKAKLNFVKKVGIFIVVIIAFLLTQVLKYSKFQKKYSSPKSKTS